MKNAFGRTDEQQKDFDNRVEKIIENLKGIKRSEVKDILNRVSFFLNNEAILS